MLLTGYILIGLVILLMAVHEELQKCLTFWSRWYRRRYRPTHWTSRERQKIAHLVVKVAGKDLL